MLTADLVLARVVRGEVRPRYIDAEDPDILALAEQLIEVFATHDGRSRFELENELKELTGTGTDFLLHRALAKLLYDRCDFETASATEPELLRQALFKVASEAYAQPTAEGERPGTIDRDAVITTVASDFDLSPTELEQSLYADLKDQQVLSGWKSCKPSWLLRRYNVALAQGVLLRATELKIEIAAQTARRQRALFRKIKFFRLLHRVQSDGSKGHVIHLDGPLSVFQSSGRYGIQMASFLPTLLHFKRWTLEAAVRWGKARRPYTFQLSADTGLVSYTRLTGQWQPEELSWLPDQLAKLDSPWEVSTDAELLTLGGQGVLVPDFVFQHRERGTRVFMEVLGFWNKGAVDSRLRLLREHGPNHLILALSKQLATGRGDLGDLPGEVYVFRAHPIARQVVKILEERFGDG